MSLFFAFNNCAKVGQQSSVLNASSSLASKVSLLSQKYQGQIAAGFCEDSMNYSCMHKIFSPQVQSEDLGPSQECVNLIQGGQVCPQTSNFSYDTSVATRACSGHCTESYDYDEYDCHIKLLDSQQGIFPIVVTDAILAGSVEKLHESCLQIQRGSN